MGLGKSKAQVLFEQDMKRRETVIQHRKTVSTEPPVEYVPEKTPPVFGIDPELDSSTANIFALIIETHGPGEPGGSWQMPAVGTKEHTAAHGVIPYKQFDRLLGLLKMQDRSQHIRETKCATSELELSPVFPMSIVSAFAFLGHRNVVSYLLAQGCPAVIRQQTELDPPVFENGSAACAAMLSPLMYIPEKIEMMQLFVDYGMDFKIRSPCAGHSVESTLFTMHLSAYEIAIHRGLVQAWEAIEVATFGKISYQAMCKKIRMADLAKSWCHAEGEDHLCRMLFADLFLLFQDYCKFPGSVCRLIGEYYSTRAKVIANVVKF